MVRGAWWATVHEVTKSQTWLNHWTTRRPIVHYWPPAARGSCLRRVEEHASPGLWSPQGTLQSAKWYASSTCLETILLKDLLKGVLSCLSLKRFCPVHQTEAAKLHFPVSANLVLFMNTRKAGNVCVQRVTEKVVLWVIKETPVVSKYSGLYYFREGRLSQLFPKHVAGYSMGRRKKRFHGQTSLGKARLKQKGDCDGISHGFHDSHNEPPTGGYSMQKYIQCTFTWTVQCGYLQELTCWVMYCDSHCWLCLPKPRSGKVILAC